MHSLLQLVSPAARTAVEATALMLVRENEQWATRLLGANGPTLCGNLALIGAAICPTLALDRLQVWLRLCLWTFLLDNMLDDPDGSEAELTNVEKRVVRVFAGAGSDDVLEVSLRAILASLRSHDPGDFWMPRVVSGLSQGLAAGVEHSALSRQVRAGLAPAPSAENYLDLASRSINHRGVATALILLLDERPLPPSDLRLIDRALDAAGRAIRLANDLRSTRRHQEEGILNVLLLRHADGSAVTPTDVRAEIDRHVDAHDKATSLIAGSSSVPEILRENLRLSVGAYRIGDLR